MKLSIRQIAIAVAWFALAAALVGRGMSSDMLLAYFAGGFVAAVIGTTVLGINPRVVIYGMLAALLALLFLRH